MLFGALAGQRSDWYNLVPNEWDPEKDLLDRLEGTVRSNDFPLACVSAAHFRRSVLARMILDRQLADHEAFSLYHSEEVRDVVARLTRAGLLGRRSDLVVLHMSKRPVLEALMKSAEGPGRLLAARSLSPEDHRRQLWCGLPLRRGWSFLLMAAVSVAAMGLWHAGVWLLGRGDGETGPWLLFGGMTLGLVLSAMQHVVTGKTDHPDDTIGKGCLVFIGLGIAVGILAWRLAVLASWMVVLPLVALVIVNLLVPELILRWRGALLLYPTRWELWRQRLLWLAITVGSIFALAWVSSFVLQAV
jgi:hypothetical protein